jgi:pilus assembly protein Flp/PilA
MREIPAVWKVNKMQKDHAMSDQMLDLLGKLVIDEIGATAIEYGLIAALIAIAAMAVMQGLGGEITSSFAKSSVAMAASNAS